MTAHQPFPCQPPLISVVLAVGLVERFLPGSLDSILGQPDPPGGIEVIAVDDASPDACGRILEERAATDSRLRVFHLSRGEGPGPARMLGLGQARGDYVWFADPDDLLTPGSLAAVAGRLVAVRPDLLLLDYRTLLPSGRTEPSPGAALLTGGEPDCVLRLADRPALIERTMTLWSKVFAREFLAGLGVTMPVGIHEDVPVSAWALLRANRIALLDQTCYLYRRRPGSLLATPSTDHFSIFDAYAKVFALLDTLDAAQPGQASEPDEAGEPGQAGEHGAAIREAVFGRAISHYSSILASGLVPRHARRRYFARMAADFRRYRPPSYRNPAGPRGLKTSLICHDAYLPYTMLAPANQARVAARRVIEASR